MATADRIAVLNAGRLEQFDRPQAIYERPASLFVADFIGVMNRLQGRLTRRDGSIATVQLNGKSGETPALDNPSISVGSAVAAVVRPENITLRASNEADHPGSPPRRLRGKVAEVIFLGEKITVLVQTDNGMFTTRLGGDSARRASFLGPGAPVDICWAQDDLLIYPEDGLISPT